eukprot:518267-Alexandrium_andersonii.AAC.1
MDQGEEARRWANFVLKLGARLALADAPRNACLTPALELLEQAGYTWLEFDLNASCCGDGLAWRRKVLLAAGPNWESGTLRQLGAPELPEGSAGACA